MPAAEPGGEPMLAFRVAGRRLALPADRVREVARVQKLNPVPHAPASLLGIGNIRGEATAVVSAAALLGMDGAAPRQLILLGGAHPAALAIDQIEGVTDDAEGCELPPFAELLEAAFPARAASAGGRAVRPEAKAAEAESVALLVFAIGDQHFALPLDEIHGVTRVPDEIARLPHGDAATIGSFLWRDRAVPLFSLAALLDLPGEVGGAARIVVVGVRGQAVGLVVDRVQTLLRTRADRIDPLPAALQRSTAETVIQAIHRPRAGGRLVSILAAKAVLRDDLVAKLGSVPEAKPVAKAEMGEATEPVLIFASGDQRFALPLAAVQEVARAPKRLSPLPKAPAFLSGVTGHRGGSLLVVDLARYLHGRATTARGARLLILHMAGAETGLLVGGIERVVQVPVGGIAPAPPLGGLRTAAFARVANLDHGDGPTLVLAPDALSGQIEAELADYLASGSARRS